MKKTTAVILCIVLCLSLLPAGAMAATASTHTIYSGEVDGSAVYSFEPGEGLSAVGLFVYGSDGDTYTLTSEVDLLVVSNVTVTVGESGSYGELKLSGGSVINGNLTITPGSCSTKFTDDAGNDPDDIDKVVTFVGTYLDGTTYNGTLTGNYVGGGEFYDLTIPTGMTFTIPAAGENEDPVGINIFHSLVLEGTGRIAAANGSVLEFYDGATFPQTALYEDVEGAITPLASFEWTEEEDERRSFSFDAAAVYDPTPENAESGDEVTGIWLLNRGGNGPAVPEDGKFTVDWDDGTPENGTAPVVTYAIDGNTPVTATRGNGDDPNNATDITIAAGADLTVSYTPAKDSEDTAEDFWGIRVTRRGEPDSVTDVPKAELSESLGVYSYTVQRFDGGVSEAAENAGLLVEIFRNDPNGGGREPQNTPQYRVRYDSNALNVTLGGETFTYEGQDRDYPSTVGDDSLVFTFAAKPAGDNDPENIFYGLKVTVYGETQTASYIKAGAAGLLETGEGTGTYTFTLPETEFTDNIEIEALSQPAAFNGEFMVSYEDNDGAAVSFTTGLTVGAGLSSRSAVSFTAGAEYTFTLTPPQSAAETPIVKIKVNGNDDADTPVVSAGQTEGTYTFSYTAPAENSENFAPGFVIEIYWSQAQYNFENLQAGQDQFMVEYAWSGNGTVTHEGGVSSASYNDCTKVVLTSGTESLILTLTPTEGGNPANEVTGIMMDGTNVQSADYAGGSYSMVLNGSYSRAEVAFTMPVVSTTFTITPSVVGENGGITPNTIQTLDAGQGREFTFTPDRGCEIDQVLVDGEPVSVSQNHYGFEDVQANHTISVSFKQVTGEAGNAVTAKEKIEGRHWAYAGNAAAIKTAFVTELWDMASHEFSGVFADSAAVLAAVTLSSETSLDETEITGCHYYTFTVELGESDAAGRIYVLPNATDYVVMTTKDTTKKCSITSGDMCSVVADYDDGGIEVFGNGAAIEGRLGSDDYHAAFHVTDRAGLGASAFQLAVYKPDFAGVKVTAAGESNYAAAWGFAQFPVVATNGSTAASPDEFEVFFGNTSVTIAKPEVSGISVTGIASVTTSLPAGAVTIAGSDGAYTVTFNSNFYDEIPLVITYTTENGAATGYLTIRRVGIAIEGYRRSGDDVSGNLQLNHGTDPGPEFTGYWGEGTERAVFATYYYPTGTESESVELYVTCTWADGTVTRRRLTQTANHDDAGSMGNSVALDDFELFKGTAGECPVKIEVTVLKTGAGEGYFAGAKLGSGSGVEWEYADSFED